MIQYKIPNLAVFQSALFCTNTTVISSKDAVLIVDPNWLPHEIDQIKKEVAYIQGNRELYLLFTHSDYDHIIGWKAFSGAKTIASKAFCENIDKEKIIAEIIQFDHDYYITRNYSIGYPTIDIVVEKEGQMLKIGDTRITFYHAPGHNKDGIFTIFGNRYWIAGDYFSDVEFPFIYHSVKAYKNTIEKMDFILHHHPIEVLIPGHGSIAIGMEEILDRKKEVIWYLNELQEHVINGKLFDEKHLWQRYKFRKNMEKFHAKNIRLALQEATNEKKS